MLDKTADAVVIGGGILGASTAHFLAKRGFGKIVLLEKDALASGSTGHSAANVRTYYSNPVTAQLAWRAVQMFEEDEEELGGDSVSSRWDSCCSWTERLRVREITYSVRRLRTGSRCGTCRSRT